MAMSFENTSNEQLISTLREKRQQFTDAADYATKNTLNAELGDIMAEIIKRNIQDAV
jgi:hypothetical protein